MKKLITSLAAIAALGMTHASHADWLTDLTSQARNGKKPADMVKVKPDASADGMKARMSLYSCWAEVVNESVEYKTELERGKTNGAISPAEDAKIKKLDAEMEKAIADAKKDGMNVAECRAIHRKISDQKAAVAKMMVYRCDPQMSCFGEITRARNRFLAGVKRGVADKTLSPTELASLKKAHDDLVEMENKVFADGKISQKECEDIQAKIIDEEKVLKQALLNNAVTTAAANAPAGAAPAATPAPTAAQGAGTVAWVKGVQANSLAAGDPIQGKPVRICRLVMADGVAHTGAEFDGNCYVGYGGKAIKQPVTETLAVNGQATWVAASANNIPANAPAAGAAANGVTMRFCRGKADAGLVPGKEYRGTCYVPSGDKEVKLTQYEVLTVK